MNRDVQLQIEGGLPEKLICRALEAGAQLTEVRRLSPRRIDVRTDAASAEILLGLCRRWYLDCRVVSRGGASELLRRMRSRWTLALGCLLALVLCMLFLSRLWRVEVAFTGPAAGLGKEEAVRSALAAEGVRPGMFLGEIDADLLQKKLLVSGGDYSFIGVRVQGIRLLVEAAPELPSPALYDREYARDLVALRDGVVLSVNARSGAACVKAGDTVRAGQTLIRGEEQKSKEETNPVAALGEVVARCWFEGSAEGDLLEETRVPTGNVRRACRLRLGKLSIPITACEGFDAEEIHRESLPVVGLFLPLEIERTTHIETAVQTRERDVAQLKAELTRLARADAAAKARRSGLAIETLSFWEDFERIGNRLRVRAVCEITADIAATRDVFAGAGSSD